jgi:hypothetical protein
VNDGMDQGMSCQGCRDRMEDCLVDGVLHVDAQLELAAHLRECAACREAFDAAQLAGAIVRSACEPPPQVSGAFVTRVMAAIRDQDDRRTAAGAFWRPIEHLASRFAMAASVLLLAASVYLVEFAPPFPVPPVNPQTEVGALIPDPPAQPSNQDEVLMSLVEMENGY